MPELVDHLAGLTGTRDRDVIDVTLVQVFRELLAARSVAIYRRVGEPGHQRWLTRARLQHDDAVPTSDPAWAELDELPALESEPERCTALVQGTPVRLETAAGTRCIFPLGSDHETVGVLEIETGGALEPSDERVVASILRIYRNFHALLDYGERDMLTGLLNRKSFDDAFLKALADTAATGDTSASDLDDGRRRREPARHYLGVIDIDHFKSVNDRFGHLIGDEVLLLLARLMRGSFRYRDQLYRFGGEEFVSLVRCPDDASALRVFERLRANTETYPFPQVGRITVSVGFTELRLTDTPASAFERADRAVYFAKANGRNQVRSHRVLVERGDLADAAKVGGIELF